MTGPIDRTIDKPVIVTGTYWWNKPTLRALFTTAQRPPRFIWSFDAALTAAKADQAALVAWASRLTHHQEQAAADASIELYRIEDGFLRSIGLGAGFVTAASLAIDRRGIYYDASRPSDLEHMLQTVELLAPECERGTHIRQKILNARLTKYNLTDKSHIPPFPAGRKIVLVPGQVSDDASILQTKSTTIDATAPENVNAQLLAVARERNPEAFIVYKPHPDVTSGLRAGHISAEIAARHADCVLPKVDIIGLLERADCVETISSLVGFEALLRGKPVTTHGLPFYAGWGLTEDLTSCSRRTRKRSIDELTAIAFTRYTRHMDPYSGRECTVEELISALIRQRSDTRHHIRNAALKKFAWFCERLQR